MKHASRHTSHKDVINRLKRADGHLRKIIDMMEHERPCLDVAQQLYAVEKAVAGAKRLLIHDHIDHCLDRSVQEDGHRAVSEFKELTKYL